MPMTVKDLRVALDGFADDLLVVLQKDAEGNGYSPLSNAGEAMYVAETTWHGEAYPTPEELAVLVANPGSGWDASQDGAPGGAVRVLVLGPVN